jgi:hypothetical protein
MPPPFTGTKLEMSVIQTPDPTPSSKSSLEEEMLAVTNQQAPRTEVKAQTMPV